MRTHQVDRGDYRARIAPTVREALEKAAAPLLAPEGPDFREDMHPKARQRITNDAGLRAALAGSSARTQSSLEVGRRSR